MTRQNLFLKEPQKKPGVRAPLFDRLREGNPLQFYHKDDIMASIEREVALLLNTRTTLKRHEYDELAQDPLNFALPEMYGIPEFSMIDGTNSTQWRFIANTCARAIAYFEPRLKNVQVVVEGKDSQTQSLSLSINADLLTQALQEPVMFPVALQLGA